MRSADQSNWGLTTADDNFHDRNNDPWWTETVWFAWMVPERNLLGYFYPVFRPNLGVQAGGMLVFDDRHELPWEILVNDFDWHRQIPAGLDLRDGSFGPGMSLKCNVPGVEYDFAYEGRDFSIDMRATAITKPLITKGSPPFINGHIDQLCQVTGTMVMGTEEIAVDCIAMRDRSWGPRVDGRQPTVGYSYAATDADNAFLAVTIAKGGPWNVTMGFLIRDGEWAKLLSGERRVERDRDGRPRTIHVDAVDELGRELHAVGESVSRQVLNVYPSMFCWNSLVNWEGDVAGWGEDQDCWHPRRWKQFLADRQQLA